MITVCSRDNCEYFRVGSSCTADVCPYNTEQSTAWSAWDIKQPMTRAERKRALFEELVKLFEEDWLDGFQREVKR